MLLKGCGDCWLHHHWLRCHSLVRLHQCCPTMPTIIICVAFFAVFAISFAIFASSFTLAAAAFSASFTAFASSFALATTALSAGQSFLLAGILPLREGVPLR